jgi:hypothetical protein
MQRERVLRAAHAPRGPRSSSPTTPSSMSTSTARACAAGCLNASAQATPPKQLAAQRCAPALSRPVSPSEHQQDTRDNTHPERADCAASVAQRQRRGRLGARVDVSEEAAQRLVVPPALVGGRVLAQRQLPEAAADLVAALANLARGAAERSRAGGVSARCMRAVRGQRQASEWEKRTCSVMISRGMARAAGCATAAALRRLGPRRSRSGRASGHVRRALSRKTRAAGGGGRDARAGTRQRC